MSELETNEVGGEAPAKILGPSTLLRAAREELKLTQKEVADKLFLTTSFIQYIDDGEFDRILKPAFLKGYLRTYARVVGLSGDEMVALYEAELEAATPTPEIRGVTEEKVGTATITGPVLQSGVIGLVVLVVIISVIWFFVSDDEDSHTAPIDLESSQGTQNSGPAETSNFDFIKAEDEQNAALGNETIPEANAQTSQRGVNVSPPDDVPVAVAQSNARGVSASTDQTESRAEEGVDFERTSDGDRSVIKVDAGGFDQLVLSFTGECWVEVSDSERGLVYNDLNREEDILTVYGSAPFRVLLGKATVVEMIYNGRPFDLAQHTEQDSTAKFTVAD